MVRAGTEGADEDEREDHEGEPRALCRRPERVRRGEGGAQGHHPVDLHRRAAGREEAVTGLCLWIRVVTLCCLCCVTRGRARLGVGSVRRGDDEDPVAVSAAEAGESVRRREEKGALSRPAADVRCKLGEAHAIVREATKEDAPRGAQCGYRSCERIACLQGVNQVGAEREGERAHQRRRDVRPVEESGGRAPCVSLRHWCSA